MLFHIILLCLIISFVNSVSKHDILIVVSYDAFRYNFFDTKVVPHMDKLKHEGTYADYLINVFPTKTFPNHHTIATGIYPETHGIIGNSYYNTTTKKVVYISEEMYSYNDRVIPIWRHNEDMGDERYSGVMMWPGGQYTYQNKNVTYIEAFNLSEDWYDKINTVMSWIMDPEKPANLVMVYFEEPDTHGHAFGPNSPVTLEYLKKLDNITQYLEDQLEKNNLISRVNVVHVSDHGLAAVTPPRFINLTQYLPPDTYKIAGVTPCLQFHPKKGYELEIYQKLTKASTNNHFKVYRKEDYPDRWHYGNNPRSPPILVLADVGYAFDDLIINAAKYAKRYNFTVTNSSEFGVHGYDYTEPSMHPFFMARGPKIRKQHRVAPFQTTDLFNLFCKILGIPPTNNNGTTGNIVGVLTNGGTRYTLSSVLVIAIIFSLIIKLRM